MVYLNITSTKIKIRNVDLISFHILIREQLFQGRKPQSFLHLVPDLKLNHARKIMTGPYFFIFIFFLQYLICRIVNIRMQATKFMSFVYE